MKFRKRKYQLGGTYMPNAAEARSEQQTQGLIAGVGAVNPLIGGFLKLGQAVGSQTMDEDGLYKSKAGQFLDNSINPSTGIQNLKDVFKNPTGSNIANQLSLGLIGKGATQERREHAKGIKDAAEMRGFETRMNSKLLGNNFDLYGNQSEGAIYKTGGKLLPLNSDTVEVEGATHEQGGVKIPGAELEDEETVAGDFVFSDYLGFAEKHKPIAKQIGILEKKPLNRERRVTMEILRKKEAALKQQQEGLKAELGLTTGKEMQLGGPIIGRNGFETNVAGPWANRGALVNTLMGQGFGTGKAYTDPEGFPTVANARQSLAISPTAGLDKLSDIRSIKNMLRAEDAQTNKWKTTTTEGIVSTYNKKFRL
jgi:hypothetical protein